MGGWLLLYVVTPRISGRVRTEGVSNVTDSDPLIHTHNIYPVAAERQTGKIPPLRPPTNSALALPPHTQKGKKPKHLIHRVAIG